MKTRPADVENSCEYLPKASFLDVYKSNDHIACYNFYQQCKDHFVTAGAKIPNCILFPAFFFQNRINFYWQ